MKPYGHDSDWDDPVPKSKYKSSYFKNDEYEVNHDLSDDEAPQGQINSNKYSHASPIVFTPRPHYQYIEVFQRLLLYRQYQGKFPSISELDSFKGSEIQPISLNFVSQKMSWHIPLNETESGQLINTFMDQKLSGGCNNYMFNDPNPELALFNSSNNQSTGKNKLLKFQAIFNISQLPTSIQTHELTQKFTGQVDYKREFTFDKTGRLTSAS